MNEMLSLEVPKLLLYGEGPSDIVVRGAGGALLVEMLLTVLIDRFSVVEPDWMKEYIEQYWTKEELRSNLKCVHRSEIAKQKRNLFRPSLRDRDPVLLDLKNQANCLGMKAQEEKFSFCVFFHDSDKHSAQEVSEAIRKGFLVSNFSGGIAMVPQPTSEAWVLAGMRLLEDKNSILESNARSFEESLKGNDNNVNSAKTQLAMFVTRKSSIKQLNSDEYQHCIEELNANCAWFWIYIIPSFRLFVESVESALTRVLVGD